MKKYLSLFIILTLAMSMMIGCGSGSVNSTADNSSAGDKKSPVSNKYTNTVSWSADSCDTVFILGEPVQLPCKFSVLQDLGVVTRYGDELPEALQAGETKSFDFTMSDEKRADIMEDYWANVSIINTSDATLSIGDCMVYSIDLEIMDAA